MLNVADVAASRKKLGQATTLPSATYTSPDFFEKETREIFYRSWHLAGRLDEFSKPGDVHVVDTVAGSALICMQDTPRAFINACRHRGTRLKNQNGNYRTLVCPYHSWVYQLDGRLKAASGMNPRSFNRSEYGLQPVRMEQWAGFVFINFDETAPLLHEWLGDLPEQRREHRPQELRCVRRFEFNIKANWKFLIENALEAYHTGTVHRDTLGSQHSEPVNCRGNWNALYVSSDTSKSLSTLPGESQQLPYIKGLSEKALRGAWFTVVYPATQLVFSPDCVWWLDFQPVSVDETRLTLGACFPQTTIQRTDFESAVQAHYERWQSATPEDNRIAEAQQRGHNSGLTMAGRYAESEHCVHALDNWVLDQVFGPLE